ncbi:hypothetical protein EDD85DRAFT_935786 [Armillaria nabsnona]|nr:hypothetical protein EDD85DRAFT_935786 [Armillaria nabsnona]
MSLKSDVLDFLYNGDPFQNYRSRELNEATELALLHGIYTGIVSVALWNICGWNMLAVFSIYPKKLSHTVNNKSRSIGRVMVAVIMLLYIATTINFFLNLTFFRYVFIEDTARDDDVLVDEEVYVIKLVFRMSRTSAGTGIGITAVMSTVIADSIMVCAILVADLDIRFGIAGWSGGGRWLVVLFPIFCLISGFGPDQLYHAFKFYVSLLVVYISCILATTLWCTILIVIRILIVTRGANDRLGDYHHIIEVLVESSALHSVTLIIYIALVASNITASDYFDALAAITTGVAPTLLAGRVAAGHARPDDSWEGSIISSLRFEAHPQADAETCSQVDSMVDNDLEAQSIQVDEPEEIGAE